MHPWRENHGLSWRLQTTALLLALQLGGLARHRAPEEGELEGQKSSSLVVSTPPWTQARGRPMELCG